MLDQEIQLDRKTMGNRIGAALFARGWTHRHLADVSGVSTSTIHKIIKLERSIRYDTLILMLAALDLEMHWTPGRGLEIGDARRQEEGTDG